MDLDSAPLRPEVSPLAARIADLLAERIQAGGFAHRPVFPSERALAAEFRVSRTSVREALRLLETRGLIVRTAHCRPVVRASSPPARPRPTGRQTIGTWIWPGPTDTGMAALMRGIYRALDASAYRLVVGSPDWVSWSQVIASETEFLEHLVTDTDVVGALICHVGGEYTLPSLRKLHAARLPMVFLDRLPPALPVHFVGVDNRHAAEGVVRHLLERGHRRIAHLTNTDVASTVGDRMSGYRRALERAGIAFDSALVAVAKESSQAEVPGIYAAILERWQALDRPPTAVFAVNDQCAHRLCTVARARGIRIPQDLAVAGFDGLEHWQGVRPVLTSAVQPFDRMGECAVELLLQAIAEPDRPVQHLLLEAPLSLHESA